MTEHDVLVVGGGHNGLICACYLARAGLRVLVLEMADRIGGAVHTAATIPELPDYRFDTCSVVHNQIQTTTILQELRLADVGLRYVEHDPFMTSFLPDGDCVRFYRSVERTCAEIARFSARDAEAYRAFIRLADALVEASLVAFDRSADRARSVAQWVRRADALARAVGRVGPRRLAGWLAGPYGPLLEEWFATEYVRAGLAIQAAHGTIGPQVPAVGFFVLWQAAFHRYGSWHARGGSGALASALRDRLRAWGGEVRTSARVTRIVTRGRATGVELAGGERIGAARAIVAAINPQTALLRLLDEADVPSDLATRLRARHRSNAVQFVVHAALDRLPPWMGMGDRADAWNGMQTTPASLAQVRRNFLQAEAGLPPDRPAVYVVTPSVIDETVAPAGRHTAYIACPAYPARFADGSTWGARAETEAHRLLDAVAERAPGFRDGILGLAWRHAEDWEREIGLVGGHPMHLDIGPDQIGPLRPLPELAGHRTPVRGLYVSGAGTYPTGGVLGVPGRSAAKAVLADIGRSSG